jgi:hypothetical protein
MDGFLAFARWLSCWFMDGLMDRFHYCNVDSSWMDRETRWIFLVDP